MLVHADASDWRGSRYYHYYAVPRSHREGRHWTRGHADRCKLIHYYRIGEWDLFDLEKDLYEVRSVYSDPARAEVSRQAAPGPCARAMRNPRGR